jgi:NADPH-dependent ferric siderophore reductase
MNSTERSVHRVRHETKMRRLRVVRVARLSPKMQRVTLSGPDLVGFVSSAADDHVKVVFPRPGEPLVLPPGKSDPPGDPSAPEPIKRDYTPRHFDAAKLELDIEFALHGDGPAAQWAAQAAPGQELGVGGPRGSFVVSGDFDWYLLVGDETALPAIARRLGELPSGAKAIVIAEVDDAAEELKFTSKAQMTVQWLHRGAHEAGDAGLFTQALTKLVLPAGTGYSWIACESNVARQLRSLLLGRGFDRKWLKSVGYWKRGASNTHEKHED